MNSSIDNPLAFFQYVTVERNFISYTNQILYYSDFVTCKIDDFKTIEYTELNYYNEPINGNLELSQIINPRLKNELEVSKTFLKQFCTENENLKVENYLRIQFNIIQSIINDNYEFINKYPYLILPLRGIVKFMNDVLILPDTADYSLNEEKISIELVNNSLVEKSNIELIDEIFHYMSGKNEKQEVILEEEEFNLLIEYTTHLIELEEVPEITNKITAKLKNGNILISYWVLHKKLYTTKKIRPYFYDFVKVLFTNFESSEIKSISKQFGTTSHQRVSNFDFLPNIISDYLK